MKRKVFIIFCISLICAIIFSSIIIAISDNNYNKEENKYSDVTKIYDEKRIDKAQTQRAIMIDGKIYLEEGPVNILRCGMCDGIIHTTTEDGSIPTRNDESNFGIGYRYQKGGEVVDVFVDKQWIRFNIKE